MHRVYVRVPPKFRVGFPLLSSDVCILYTMGFFILIHEIDRTGRMVWKNVIV